MLGSQGLFCTSWEAKKKEGGLAFSPTILFAVGHSSVVAKGSCFSVYLVQQSQHFLPDPASCTHRPCRRGAQLEICASLFQPSQTGRLTPTLTLRNSCHVWKPAECHSLPSPSYLQMPQKCLGLGAGGSCAHPEPQELSQAPWPGMKQPGWNAGAPTHEILLGGSGCKIRA